MPTRPGVKTMVTRHPLGVVAAFTPWNYPLASPTRKVAERYSTSTRTIERWEIDPTLNFPKPIKIKRRKYWYEDELDEFDAAQG